MVSMGLSSKAPFNLQFLGVDHGIPQFQVNSLGGSMSKIPVKHAVCSKAEVCFFWTGVAPELSAPCCLSKNI